MTISCNGASFIARQLEYRMTGGWEEGDSATNRWFRPVETFEERFRELVFHIRSLGFDALDIWTAELNWLWATSDHIVMARRVLDEAEVAVSTYAGHFGDNIIEFEAACQVTRAIGADVMGGSSGLLRDDRQSLEELLEAHELRFGFENYPTEKTPDDVRARIDELSPELVGVCLDTGWFGTNGYNALDALKELWDRLVVVHLKDVREAGSHLTCRFGEGVVPVQDCVAYLEREGYPGPVSIVHEPEDFDPSDDLAQSLRLVRRWQGGDSIP